MNSFHGVPVLPTELDTSCSTPIPENFIPDSSLKFFHLTDSWVGRDQLQGFFLWIQAIIHVLGQHGKAEGDPNRHKEKGII